MPTLRERIITRLFGDIIQAQVEALAAVSIRVDDSPGWDSLTQAGPADRPWGERADDLDDALVAWRKNFFIRRIVTLTRSYVVGSGISMSSEIPEVDKFVHAFWDHQQNRLAGRLGPMCDELTRAGELFPVLFTNRADGMSYIRFIPASRIREIETDEEDYEIELRYGQMQNTSVELKWWIGPGHPHAYKRVKKVKDKNNDITYRIPRSDAEKNLLLRPLMLHFTVNKVIGATRGEGDLGPILPWAKRYAEWLKDRVRLNRQRTRQGVLDVEIADPAMVQEKRQQLRTRNPVEHGIYVHGPGETVSMHSLDIKADDVKEDGKALRLAIATGANIALHFTGEGEGTNYATAKEMGEPTARFFSDRQDDFCAMLTDLTEAAFKRKVAMGLAQMPEGDDLHLKTSVTEIARADNQGLAQAAKDIVDALREMKAQGWITDDKAIRLAFKFCGELIDENEIITILQRAEEQTTEQPEEQPEE